MENTATRVVHCADAVTWLQTNPPAAGTSVVTSLPDVSEVGRSLDVWRAWFVQTAALVMRSIGDADVALFFQSDITKRGRLVDKAHLVTQAAEAAGSHVLFHKVVCRKPPGTLTTGRPGFTHLLAVSRARVLTKPTGIPDVIDAPGESLWVRGIGVNACALAVKFARDHAGARCILDPFCGVGTVLAAANALGLSAVGVELNVKRARGARTLAVGQNPSAR